MFFEISKSEKIARTKTRNSIEKNIPQDLLSKQFVKNLIDEYMIYYDIMTKINHRLAGMNKMDDEYMDLIKEKRQISKEMRNALDYLSNFQNSKSSQKELNSNEIKL
nr:MAG TPA: hypothetical protein [Caudoviricetes sp.]